MQDLNTIKLFSYNTKQLLKHKINKYFMSLNLKELAKSIFICKYKVSDPDSLYDMFKFVSLQENTISIFSYEKVEIIYNYETKEVLNYLDFFEIINKKDLKIIDIDSLKRKIEDINNKKGSLLFFDMKGLESIFISAHECKIDFTYEDYLLIIKGYEEEYFIEEEEFYEYKKEVVGDFVVNGLLGILGDGFKKKRLFKK